MKSNDFQSVKGRFKAELTILGSAGATMAELIVATKSSRSAAYRVIDELEGEGFAEAFVGVGQGKRWRIVTPGTPPKLIGGRITPRMELILDHLSKCNQGATISDLSISLGFSLASANRSTVDLKKEGLIHWAEKTSLSGDVVNRRVPIRYYLPEKAPTGAITEFKSTQYSRRKKQAAPANPIDSSVDGALDAISILAAERETYKSALLKINELIDLALNKK